MTRPVRTTGIVTAFAMVLFLLPTAIVLVASLSTGKQIVFPPHGVTLHWYSELLGNGALRDALANSLYVAAISVVVNIAAGVPAALALPRVGRHSQVFFTVLLSLGLSSPTIVSAFAYFDLFGQVGLDGNLTAIGVGLAVVAFPFMLWTISAALQDLDDDLMPVAATLGADPVEQFLFVRLPLLAPGIVTGALIVFVLSITDFVICQVLTTVDNPTLPVFIYGGLRDAISPALGAASALFIGVAAVVFAIVLRLGKVERFLFRA
jgi:putative spermidine/putrescine transport system permease protein